jgi:hypothetical protein
MSPSQFLKIYFNIILLCMPLSSKCPPSLKSPLQNPLYISPLLLLIIHNYFVFYIDVDCRIYIHDIPIVRTKAYN